MRFWFVVVFLLGGALWLAMPVCGCSTRAPSYAGYMKMDMKSLASAQEIYWSDQSSFSADISALQMAQRSELTIQTFGDEGWTGRAKSDFFDDTRFAGADCVAYGGSVPEIPQTTRRGREPPGPGQVACDLDGKRFSMHSRIDDLKYALFR